jgi:uncharacterized membrane protein YccC
MPRATPLHEWRQPVVTVLGMSLALVLLTATDAAIHIAAQPGALVLVAALAMTLSRNRLIRSWRGRGEAVILLPAVALATVGVGELVLHVPAVGALAFTAAMFASIWLRKFGPTATRIGSLIALPFITLLIVPGGGGGTPAWGIAVLSVGVLAVVVSVRLVAEATGLLQRVPRAAIGRIATPAAGDRARAGTQRASSLRPVASTRMAVQLAVALAAAWIAGFVLFPQHVTWVVLTAFLVCSGNRGRADVLYKSGLRVIGAAAGTVAASGLLLLERNGQPLVQGPALVVLLLGILGVGLWLRAWTYAAWALAMTLVITLLQGALNSASAAATHAVASQAFASQATEGMQLWIRVVAIIVGAVLGLAASWFVLPVRSLAVVRRRIADTLAALSAYFDLRRAAAEPADTGLNQADLNQAELNQAELDQAELKQAELDQAELDRAQFMNADLTLTEALDRLEQILPPWMAAARARGILSRAVDRIRKRQREHDRSGNPAAWIESLHVTIAVIRDGTDGPRAPSKRTRRALGEARRAMREPDAIGAALNALRESVLTDRS